MQIVMEHSLQTIVMIQTRPLTTAEDGDCDGVLTAADCNDNDAGIGPNLYDLTIDGIDQNCDGIDGHKFER